jgi:ArsR family transcriptional regulator
MENRTERLIDQFKALADPVRLRIIALCGCAECSVSELTGVLGLSQPRVSQHLKQLCSAGLLERFRDGHFVFYRVATGAGDGAARRRLLGLVAGDEPEFLADIDKLRALRGSAASTTGDAAHDRALHRAFIELTVAAPLGDLVDIGCGQGRILKLLASRAHRAVGVDIDSDARRYARAELLLAGIPNGSLRKGDMYALPFADGEFDTAILDDVLADAERPYDALSETVRILRESGRLLVLQSLGGLQASELSARLAGWCASAGLRLAPARSIPAREPMWLLAVATRHDAVHAAA